MHISLYIHVSLGCIPRRRIPESKNRGFFNLNKQIKFSSKCLYQCVFSMALRRKAMTLHTLTNTWYIPTLHLLQILSMWKDPHYDFNCISLITCVAEYFLICLQVNCSLLHTVRTCLYSLFVDVGSCLFFNWFT